MIKSICFILFLGMAGCLVQAGMHDHYVVDRIQTPPGIDPQIGGMDFLPDGRLVVCFHRGEIYTYQTKKQQWKLFASGLHEPLGILALSNHKVLVMQKPGLTEVSDTDGDGRADFYKNVYDDFGITGNYHEFAYGPIKDKYGNIYIALNTSHKAHGILKEIRGPFNPIGVAREEFYRGNWKVTEKKLNFMFSNVPYRGWVMKITPEGRVIPFACGLRSPNGLGWDADGRLLITDNQGDWVGTSKLFHIEEGKFYGHPASLVWKKNWTKNPFKMPVEQLNQMRTKAAILMPHAEMAKSPTQPLVDSTQGKFGPYSGQLFIGEMNSARILRMIPDIVEGQMQGAVLHFYNNHGLSRGNNRLAFDREGNLWVGQTSLGWAGGKGLQRIRWKGTVPMDLLGMKLTARGFDLTFTKRVDPKLAEDVKSYSFVSYRYLYRKSYGSPKVDKNSVAVKSAKLRNDGKTVSLELEELKAGYVYQLGMTGIQSTDGQAIVHKLACYQLNRLNRKSKKQP